MMRIITGYLQQTSGMVMVMGMPVDEHPLEVKKHIGFLPENNPLYPEMFVKEYLSFIGGIHKVQSPRKRVNEVIEMTGIGPEKHKRIGMLSKGYRQRVGLADALLGDPDLLILDEPTIGLDPVQIRQVRQLIKDLGQRHTILISTHILPEVEMTCNRVLIIHRGKILASDSPENLVRSLQAGGAVRVEVRAPVEAARAVLGALPGVRQVAAEAGSDGVARLTVEVEAGADVREAIYRAVVAERWDLRELTRGRTTLEDIFVQITREEDEAEEDRRDQRQRLR